MSSRFLLSAALAVSCALLFVSAGAPSASSVASRLAGRGVHGLNDQASAGAAVDQANQADQAFSSFQAALSDAIVQEVNAAEGATWKAGMNSYFEGKSYEFLKKSCGTKLGTNLLSASVAQDGPWNPWNPYVPSKPETVYPTEYDVRAKWGDKCPSVKDIRDQAGCGSCWAVAAAEAMTDRHCIASDGARKPYLSAHNILTCCGAQECGSCEGGYPINAWQFWARSGVVTGGAFGSSGTCQPYEWAPCSHHVNGSTLPACVAQDATPTCSNTCSGGMDYAADKSYGSSAYKVAFSEDAIMNEIMTHGPVEAGFMVYEDFPHYKSGVYQHLKGNMIGGHAVKLLGWGVEGGQKYWLVANSWNTNWGDEGYFKIAKGQNECMIEDMIFAGQVRA